MNKKVVSLGAVVGMTLGGMAPMLWGDTNILDLPSALLGMLGGFLGIWLTIWVGKRYF